jgi:2-C-methyl-D-erythritol 4-phosphate cytidylyltransferase
MAAELPKQYLALGDRTVLEHSMAALLDSGVAAQVVLALHPDDRHPVSCAMLEDGRVSRAYGGARRSDSVLAALQALESRAAVDDWVLVHDAARPCVVVADIRRLHAAVIDSGIGGILAEPLVDTVKQASAAGLVERTLDRSRLWRAQTPQMFRFTELKEALHEAIAAGAVVTDEASAMERAGFPVQLVEGSAENLKVTRPADLALAAWYLSRRA